MESKETNILDLNDYCLGQILKYLYEEDHMPFAETCTRFREIFRDWFNVLYNEYRIKLCVDPYNNIERQLKLLDIVKDIIKRFFVIEEIQTAKNSVWQMLCKLIGGMDSLEYIAIWILGQNQPILAAIEVLPKLKSISIYSYTVDHKYIPHCLKNHKCLERISLYTQITSKDLADICKSNRNLRVLWLRYVEGQLAEIVPHCANLEEIAFRASVSYNSYVAVADLPKIRKVIIRGSLCGAARQLFKAFAAKGKETQLESLISETILSVEDTCKLVKLVQLKELDCVFEDAVCIDLLKNLTELELLHIWFRSAEAGTNEYLNVLRSCRKLKRLCIFSNLTEDFGNKAMEVLRTVRNPEKQKPLQLYSKKLRGMDMFDDAYCILLNDPECTRPLPWKLPN